MSTTNISTILFTHYGDNWIRGSERCLLDLITHIDKSIFKVVLWCNTKSMADAAEELEIDVILSDFSVLTDHSSYLPIAKYLRLVKQGIGIIDKYNISLIHANSGAPNLIMNFVARARRIPLIAHLHSHYPLRERLLFGLHQVSMVIGVSNKILLPLIDDGFPMNKIKAIDNGLDIKLLLTQPRSSIRNQLGIGADKLLIATTGSLIHRKGIDKIINATIELNKKGLPIHLVVFGDGPERRKLQYQIQHSGTTHCIHLVGEKKNIVGLLQSGVDIFVASSRDEAFGLSLAEASLAGIPVIAPRIGETMRIIKHGKSGKLLNINTSSALADAINELYLAPDERKLMGTIGKYHISKHFNIKRYVDDFEKLYLNTISDTSMTLSWFSHWNISGPLLAACRSIWRQLTIQSSKGEVQ